MPMSPYWMYRRCCCVPPIPVKPPVQSTKLMIYKVCIQVPSWIDRLAKVPLIFCTLSRGQTVNLCPPPPSFLGFVLKIPFWALIWLVMPHF